MTAPVCLVSGVGPGTGSALARKFAEGGCRVALPARNEERLAALEKELAQAKGYQCDVSDPVQVEAVAAAVERDLGSPSVVVHNAVGGSFETFQEIEPSILNRNFQVDTMGLLYLARRFSPAMAGAGKGAIVVTGNTSALRGKPDFAGFAPTKAAQRILAEARARERGPQGVLTLSLTLLLIWSGSGDDSTVGRTTSSLSPKRSRTRSGTWFIRIAALGRLTWNCDPLARRGSPQWQY